MKKPLSSEKWLVLFLASVILTAALYAGFNVVTDPFGVFGDRYLQWWSYDLTNNPRVSKLAYLEQHHDEYDSYIIGSSASSSFPAEDLNRCFGGSFYNMIMYGSDMLDVEQTADYLIDNYTVRNLVICIYVHNAMEYDTDSGKLVDLMHCRADGSDPLSFYARYAFADWRYGWNKLKDLKNDGYVQADHDCFDPLTGAYDKSRRDTEPIGDLSEYISRPAYSIFADYPQNTWNIACLEQCMDSMRAIKKRCDTEGINLVVICPPMYSEYLKYYTQADIMRFETELAGITDFWDFTMSSASYDPRFFYDETHFRNALGTLALAKIAGRQDLYIPDDFGFYMTSQNVEQLACAEFSAKPAEQGSISARLPIITYHETYGYQVEGGVTTALFEEHMKALYDAGCSAVSFDDIRAYVEQGKELPQKPVLICFDDGYSCNLELAGPILKKYGFKATVFAIGTSVGKDTYKDSGVAMNPHFGTSEAIEAIESGVFDIQSHGFDLHNVEGLDPAPIRKGALPKDGESEADYIEFLRADCRAEKEVLAAMGRELGVFAYPFGKATELSEIIMAEEGLWCTLSTEPRINTLVKGLPQSLRLLGRFSIYSDVSGDELLQLIEYRE